LAAIRIIVNTSPTVPGEDPGNTGNRIEFNLSTGSQVFLAPLPHFVGHRIAGRSRCLDAGFRQRLHNCF
jgi:hypothetical protein